MVNCSGRQTLKALLSLRVLLPLLMRWETYIAGGDLEMDGRQVLTGGRERKKNTKLIIINTKI